MARRTPDHANNGNRKAGIKVHALLIVHQLCSSERLLLILCYGCCGPCGHSAVMLPVCDQICALAEPAAKIAACDVS